MRKEFTIASALMLTGLLVFSGYGWAADTGMSGGTTSDTKKKSEKSASSDMGSSDMSKGGSKSAGGSENVKKVQTALKDKGQDPGPIDGVMGPKTKAAIKAYQSANKLKPTGRLDSETAKSLGVESASSSGGGSSSSQSSKSSSSSDMGSDKSGSSATKQSSQSSFGSDRPSGRNAPSSRDKSDTTK